MSFINLEFMGIQSPDIMADSVDTKQIPLTLNSKLDWLNSLQNIPFHRSCMNDSSREAGMIRFVKTAIFSGVQKLSFIRKATARGAFNC